MPAIGPASPTDDDRVADFVNENDDREADDQRQRRLRRVGRDAERHRRAGHGKLGEAESLKGIHREPAHVIENDEGDRLHHSGSDHQRREQTRKKAALARFGG